MDTLNAKRSTYIPCRYRTITQKSPNYLKDQIMTEKGINPKNQTNNKFLNKGIHGQKQNWIR